MSFDNSAKEWLAGLIGSSADQLEITRMKGSTSSSVYLVKQIGPPGQREDRFVLRVLDNQEWLTQEPDLAEHEAAALREACEANLRSPQLVGYSTADVGFGAPVVLMTFVEGKIELQPKDPHQWLQQLAQQLAQIHQVKAEHFPWTFRSWVAVGELRVPRWAQKPHLWERAIEIFHGPIPHTQTVFIHRDYHPMNVLWQQCRVSGVVDWINACRGPAGVDVAHCRVNLALMYGAEVADTFLEFYYAADETFRYDRYWDVDGILDMLLPEPSFYAPWLDFGLGVIGPQLLQLRAEALLERVITQTK